MPEIFVAAIVSDIPVLVSCPAHTASSKFLPPEGQDMTSEVIDRRALISYVSVSRSNQGEQHDRCQHDCPQLYRPVERAGARPPPRNAGGELDQRRPVCRPADVG